MLLIPGTTEEIEAALNDAFPPLSPLRVVGLLGSGFSSIAVETQSGLVFRIARTPGAAERRSIEMRLLAGLRGRLPVAVPEPSWSIEQTALLPHGVLGYPKLPGRPLLPELVHEGAGGLAAQIAQSLLALHHIPVPDVDSIGLPEYTDHLEYLRALRENSAPVLRELLASGEVSRIDRWWQELLADEALASFEPVLTHGDFWHENLLVDDGAASLLGIVDWEYAAIADPMTDFAHLVFHLGPRFRQQVIDAYRSAGGRFGAAEQRRMGRLWEAHGIEGVLYAARFDEDELPDELRKLRAGPIFDAA